MYSPRASFSSFPTNNTGSCKLNSFADPMSDALFVAPAGCGKFAGGRGKRGGIRVIYYWHAATEQLLMLLAYPKNEQDDLTPRQRTALRKIIESEYP